MLNLYIVDEIQESFTPIRSKAFLLFPLLML